MPSTSALLSLATLAGLAFSFPTAIPTTLLSRAAFQCPEKDIMETQCQGPSDCLYADPSNCATFIECTLDPGGQTATPHVRPCPAALKWNDRRKRCDFFVSAGESDSFCDFALPRLLGDIGLLKGCLLTHCFGFCRSGMGRFVLGCDGAGKLHRR